MAVDTVSQIPIPLLRRADAAEYIRTRYGFPCSKRWLAKLATTGGGPCYRKAGKYPVYAIEDLDRWAKARFSDLMRATGINAE